MFRLTIRLILIGMLALLLQDCRKSSQHPREPNATIDDAKTYMQSQPASNVSPSRKLDWDKATQFEGNSITSFWIPVKYDKPEFISHSLDSSRLFNTNYMQALRVWRDSANKWQHELVTYFPDSNYRGKSAFTGIVLVRNWQDSSIAAYKYEKNGSRRKLRQNSSHNRLANSQGFIWIDVCYASYGYNYANMTREIFYWSADLGCDTYYLNGGGDGYNYSSGTQFSLDYSNASNGGSPASDPAWVNVNPIKGAPNAIADIKDYDKCFDNIAGSDHKYSVTICVDQPNPGKRDAWGLFSSYPNNDYQFFNVGHTFMILQDAKNSETITRNVGFYPKSAVNPISTTDVGQLNNDEEHYYNISLTLPLDNSSFFTILNFVAHGNDQGNQYDLNSNNCTTFVINALNSAGIHIPATTGYWPGGGGYNPGDLGEDIRAMSLTPGTSKSTSEVAHPNTGKCN